MKTFLDNCQSDMQHKVLSVYLSAKKPEMEQNSNDKSPVPKNDTDQIGKVKISVQFTDEGGVLIPDGVGYTVKTRST